MSIFPLITTFKTFAIRKALNERELGFLKKKKIEQAAAPDAWNAFLKQIDDYDQLSDKARKGWMYSMILCAVLLFVGLYFESETLFWLFIVLSGVGLLGSIICYRIHRVQDIPNAFRDIVVPFIYILSEDVKQGTDITIKMDMGKPENKNKKVSKEKLTGYGGKRITRHIYHNPWFECSARTTDAGQINLKILDIVRVDKSRKTNARGKTKYKTKRKIKRRLDLRVGWPKGMHAISQAGVDGTSILTDLKSGDKRDVIRLQNMFVTKDKDYFDKWIEVDDVYRLLVRAYDCIHRKT